MGAVILKSHVTSGQLYFGGKTFFDHVTSGQLFCWAGNFKCFGHVTSGGAMMSGVVSENPLTNELREEEGEEEDKMAAPMQNI